MRFSFTAGDPLPDLLTFVVALALVLGVVTLVGHGIWVLFSKLFEGPASRPTPQVESRGPRACPRCLSPIALGTLGCPFCEWPEPLPAGERRDAALDGMGRQLDVYRRLGLVSDETHRELLQAIGLAAPEAGDPRVEVEMVQQEPPPLAPEVPMETSEDASEPNLLLNPAFHSARDTPTDEPHSGDLELEQLETDEPDRESLVVRARSYAARREAGDVDAASPAPEAPRREALGKLFAAFLEAKNIRWGELAGGLLIVCCSTALVISFWSEIAGRPLLKFCIFNGVSAALFGIGFYTNHRWKIHTTSHGILIISVLLVPLNFLAIAAFTDESPPTDLLSLGGEGVSLALFSTLTFFGARIITPGAPLLATLGVMAPSFMQLLVRRFVHQDAPVGLMYGMAGIPLASYLAASCAPLHRQAKQESLDERAANQLFIQLGIASYALLPPLALLVYKSGAVLPTVRDLAPLVVLCGAPSLATGLLFLRRITARELSTVQTAGISIGVLGAVVMVVAVVLAWPNPGTLLPTALVNVAVFTWVAWWFVVPEAHLVAGVCGMVAWLVAFHLIQGGMTWGQVDHRIVSRTLFSATSGNALAALTAAYLAIAYAWKRAWRNVDARWWAVSAAIAAACSMALITLFGFARVGDPAGILWTYAIYAVVAAAVAYKIDRPAIAWTASTLLMLMLIQAVVFRVAPSTELAHPWVVALLLLATVTQLAGLATTWRRGGEHVALRTVGLQSARASSIVAGGLVLFGATNLSWNALSVYLMWLAVVWLIQAFISLKASWFAAFQVALTAAVGCFVTARLVTYDWYLVAEQPWLEPWLLQIQGVVLALYCLAWQGVRFAHVRWKPRETTNPIGDHSATWRDRVDALLFSKGATIDQACQVLVWFLFLGLACYAAMPGVGQELAPQDQPGLAARVAPAATDFEWAGVAASHAAGAGSWILLAAVAAMLVIGLWQRGATLAALGLLLAAAASCGLVAAWWSNDVSVASALRWLVAGFVALASIPVWMRSALRPRLERLGISLTSDSLIVDTSPTTLIRSVLVGLNVALYLALGAYLSIAAIYKAGLPEDFGAMLQLLAVVLFLTAIPALLISRFGIAGAGDSPPGESSAGWRSPVQILLFTLGVGPLLVALAYAVADAIQRHPLTGPEPGTWFREVGWSVSYGVPLVVFALTLVGYAIRERSSRYAGAAGLLLNVVATMVLILELSRAGRALNARAWVEVAQVNCAVSAIVALVWMAAVLWSRRRESGAGGTLREDHAWPALLVSQTFLALALCGLPLALAAGGLFFEPRPAAWVMAAGGLLGWISLAPTILAGGVLLRGGRQPLNVHHAGWLLLSAAAIVAATAARIDTGDWFGYHTLLLCAGAAAWALLLAGLALWPRDVASGVRWSSALLVATVLIGLRALAGDPAAPWWTLAALAAMTGLSTVLAWISARRGLVWVAGVLANLAISIWWLESGYRIAVANGYDYFSDFLLVNVVVAALLSIVSAAVERKRILPAEAAIGRPGRLSFHRFAAWASIALLFAVVAVGLAADRNGWPLSANGVLLGSALLMTIIAAGACLWDPATRYPVASLYCLGLVAVGMFLDLLNAQGQLFLWSGVLLIAAFALASSYLWSQRGKLGALAANWGVPLATVNERRPATRTYDGQVWLVSANSTLAFAVTLLVFWIELTYDALAQRMAAAYAVLAVALALALLAQGAVRSSLQYSALVLGALFAVAFGWAWMPIGIENAPLHRTIVAAAALAAVIPFYGFGIAKLWRRENEWTRAAAQLNPVVAVMAVLLLLTVLGIEAAQYLQQGTVAIRWPALLTVAAALSALTLAALAAAVLPGRDPLGMSERGRTLYVYAAEALLGLLFLHIRLTMPWLFRGWFLRFWPLVVMAIALLGVGIAEWLRRRQQRVLYEPLENSGALLPLLPVLGYWMLPSRVNYALVLLSVGALYAVLSALRRSFLFGMLAVLAANGSLWYLLHSIDGLSILRHPQLSLIPPALCVLIAAHWNRARLTAEQSTAIRYLGAILIYAASTADVFINGVGEAPWLPLVLAGLSLAGIFAGILFRVRAFLYLGVSFLLVSLMTIIWHAAVELEMTWIWWVSGIVTGVLIIALFGLFEKKRDELLQLVEQVKQWEA